MKIGLYDSGIGGISVLKKFLEQHPNHEYIYYGDSARAPYGDKSPEQLITYVHEIFDFMEKEKVQIVVSACNTSSAYLNEMDLSKYSFKIISLFDTMKDYFQEANKEEDIALLATSTNIDSKRYKDWKANIHPQKCPKLVPLIEQGALELAQKELDHYLLDLPEEVEEIVLGCTHYPLLINDNENLYKHIYHQDLNKTKIFKLIDPAEVLINSNNLKDKELDKNKSSQSSVSLYSTGNINEFMKLTSRFIEDCNKYKFKELQVQKQA